MSTPGVTPFSNQQTPINIADLPTDIVPQIYLQLISQGGSCADINSLLRTNHQFHLISSNQISIVWKTLLEKYFSGYYKTNQEISSMDQFKDLYLLEKAVRSGWCEVTKLKEDWWAKTTCLIEYDGKMFVLNDYGMKILGNKKLESSIELFEQRQSIEGVAIHKSMLFLILKENGKSWPDASIICVFSSSGKLIKHLRGHIGIVTCLCTIGNLLYSGSLDSTIKVWDMDTLELLKTYGEPNKEGVGITALFPFKDDLYSGDANGGIKKWDLKNDEFIVEQVETRTREGIRSLFVDDYKLISTSGGYIYVYNRKNKTIVHEIDYSNANCVEKFGDLLFIDTTHNGSVSIWDLNTGAKLFEHIFIIPLDTQEINVSSTSLRFRQGKLFIPSGRDVVIFDFAAQLDYEKKKKEAREDSQMLQRPAKKRKLLKEEEKKDLPVVPAPNLVQFSWEFPDSSESSDEEHSQ